MRLKKLRTKLAIKIAPWIVPEVALQEMELVIGAAPKNERNSQTCTLIRTLIASYRRQAEEASR